MTLAAPSRASTATSPAATSTAPVPGLDAPSAELSNANEPPEACRRPECPPASVDLTLKNDPDRIRGKALRRSMYFCALAWAFGAFWNCATNGAPQTRLAEHLKANDFLFGVLGAAPFIGSLFQLPGAMMIEKLGRRKGLFLTWLTTQRVMYVTVALLPWLMAWLTHMGWVSQRTQIGAILMVGLLLIGWAAGQFGGQAWVNWMADLVPQRVRGKYFAKRSRIGMVVIALTGLGLGLLLDFSTSPTFHRMLGPISAKVGMPPLIFVISIIYVFASFAGIMDIQLFHKVDEPPMRRKTDETIRQRMLKPLKDAEFRRYVAYAGAFNFAIIFSGVFWWKYFLGCLDDMRKAENAAGTGHSWWVLHSYLAAYLLLQLAFNVGQIVGYPLWGRMVDRFGRKPCMFLGGVVHTASWVMLAFAGPKVLIWLIPNQFLGGIFWGGSEIANFNIMLGFNRKGGAGYQALAGVLIAGAAAAGGLVAGSVAEFLGKLEIDGAVFTFMGRGWSRYHIVIALAFAMKLFADFVLLSRVRDVEAKPTRHAVRFIVDNFYGSLNTLIFEPVRTGLERTTRGLSAVTEAVTETLTDGVGGTFKKWFR